MHLLYLTALAFASAATVELNNHCGVSLWVANATAAEPEPPVFELKSGTAFLNGIVGKGNSLGVAYSADYYKSDQPKFVLGTTQDQGRIWWSINWQDGVAWDNGTFAVSSPEPCGNTTFYDQLVHNCPDADFTVALDLCT